MTDPNNSKELVRSITRSMFSAVPYVGQLLNEIVFEFRGRIKQNRLNRFTELFSEFFVAGNDFEVENLKTEDFSDLLESVLKRVVITKSEQKLKIFRDILIDKIKNPLADTDNSEIYLDLITSLHEYEINILYHHQDIDQNYEDNRKEIRESERRLVAMNEALAKEGELKNTGFPNNFVMTQNAIYELETKLARERQTINELQTYRDHTFYQLPEDRFLYYKQRLFSKGLMFDIGVGSIGVKPFQNMIITELGKGFVKFVMQT